MQTTRAELIEAVNAGIQAVLNDDIEIPLNDQFALLDFARTAKSFGLNFNNDCPLTGAGLLSLDDTDAEDAPYVWRFVNVFDKFYSPPNGMARSETTVDVV